MGVPAPFGLSLSIFVEKVSLDHWALRLTEQLPSVPGAANQVEYLHAGKGCGFISLPLFSLLK